MNRILISSLCWGLGLGLKGQVVELVVAEGPLHADLEELPPPRVGLEWMIEDLKGFDKMVNLELLAKLGHVQVRREADAGDLYSPLTVEDEVEIHKLHA